MQKIFSSPFFFSLFLLMFSAELSAQNRKPTSTSIKKPGFLIGANGMYLSPKGNFANDYKGGPGGEILAGIGLGKTYIVGTAGYAYLFDTKSNGEGNLTYKPMKIGVRQYLLAKRLFVNADLGRATIKASNKAVTETRFIRGYGAGLRLLGIEAGLYFDGWKKEGSIGFNNTVQYKLGYNITL